MNKTELITAAAKDTGMTRKDAERVVNAMLDIMAKTLSAGEKVQLSGFGVFEIKEREARVGRNPRTKEPVQIPATRTPVFKASRVLRDEVAG